MEIKLNVNEAHSPSLRVDSPEVLRMGLNQFIGSIGVDSYEDLKNKPSINGVTLEGNKLSADLGILSLVIEDSYYAFPNIGKTNTLYIVTGSNQMYWWDENLALYRTIGFDYEDIKCIDGGHA